MDARSEGADQYPELVLSRVASGRKMHYGWKLDDSANCKKSNEQLLSPGLATFSFRHSVPDLSTFQQILNAGSCMSLYPLNTFALRHAVSEMSVNSDDLEPSPPLRELNKHSLYFTSASTSSTESFPHMDTQSREDLFSISWPPFSYQEDPLDYGAAKRKRSSFRYSRILYDPSDITQSLPPGNGSTENENGTAQGGPPPPTAPNDQRVAPPYRALKRQDTTLEEYCEEQELQLTVGNKSGVCITLNRTDSLLLFQNTLCIKEEIAEVRSRGYAFSRVRSNAVPHPILGRLDYEAKTIALEIIVNLREGNNDIKTRMIDFVKEVFEVDTETFIEKTLSESSIEKKLKMKLVCTVKHGSNFVVKKTFGKSSRYVHVAMGIIDETQQGEPIVRKGNLSDWVQKKGIMPTGETAKTGVQRATREPHWNEELVLSMGHAPREMLVVEVWNEDHSKMKKFIHKMPTFMGRAFLPIWNLEFAEGKVLPLLPHTDITRKYGSVTVDLSIRQMRKNTSLQVGMWEHMQLTHSIVNHEGRVGGQYRRKWRGELSEEAEKLLDKHAEFSGLSEAHKAAIRLSVLIKYPQMFAVKMLTFSTLIRKIIALEAEIEHSTTEAGTSQAEWVNILLKDLNKLAVDIEEALQNHLTEYSLSNPQDIKKISHRVEVLRELYAFRPFFKGLSEGKKSLPQLLERSVQVAMTNWFFKLKGESAMAAQDTPDVQLCAFKRFVECVLNICNNVLILIDPIFKEVGVSYFTLFYQYVDKMISLEFTFSFKVSDSLDKTIAYQIYNTLRKFQKLREEIPEQYHSQLRLKDLHCWFGEMLQEWVTLGTDRCKGYIENAIEDDKVVKIVEKIKFSSSAVDGTGFLFMLMRLGDELEWPVEAEALALKKSIMRSLCDCALFYVTKIKEKLCKEDMFDKQGKFRATEKLSIVFNNMQHMKQELMKMLTEEQQNRLQMDTDTHIQSTGEEISTKITAMIVEIISKIKPEIHKLMEEIVHSRLPPSKKVIDPKSLMSYLASNLQIFGSHLLTPVFQQVLTDMWHVSIDCMLNFLHCDTSRRSCDPSQYFDKLKFLCQSLYEFFHHNGNGLSEEAMRTEKYKELVSLLEILSLPTDKLILKFFAELGKIQATLSKTVNNQCSRILLSVGYHQDKEAIELDIIQANDLHSLKSGTIDPLVEVCLMPPWLFGHPQPQKQKTGFKTNDPNPLFNKEFKIDASRKSMQTKGAVLLLTILHRHLFFPNSVCGVCIVPCKKIPSLTPGINIDNPNAVERKNLTLPIFKVSGQPLLSSIVNELSSRARTSDQRATEFVQNKSSFIARD